MSQSSELLNHILRLSEDARVRDESALLQLNEALHDLARTIEYQQHERRQLERITAHINAGLTLEEILENVYEDFRELIPYERIGCALIDNTDQTVTARWARSDGRPIQLRRGYSIPLANSSLATILQTGQPRILNDLRAYLRDKPHSESTQLIVDEGYQSSLTCPLIVNGIPVGFLFFSSAEPYTYAKAHVDVFLQIAAQLSVMVEKGRLVSELASQKNAIERQNRQLVQLNDQKNTFLGIAAHDLRSPLGTIQMAISFLLDPQFDMNEHEQAAVLQDIEGQIQHMLTMIDDLLDVAQIESGKLTLTQEQVDLPVLLAAAVTRHNNLAASKGTQVLLDPVPNGSTIGDSMRLRQVLDNLLSNAVKYSPAGSQVVVSAEKLAGFWRISVRDQGPGINPEDRKRLFQDFARLSARPTGGERSTGLGLAISRRVVHAHGGQISVDSEPGHGSTFWFTLPE